MPAPREHREVLQVVRAGVAVARVVRGTFGPLSTDVDAVAGVRVDGVAEDAVAGRRCR